MPCPDPYRYFASKCWRVLDDATGPAMLPDDRSLDEMSAGVHSFLQAATLLCAGDRALVTEMVLCGAGSARDVQLITCEAVALARAWANKGSRCRYYLLLLLLQLLLLPLATTDTDQHGL